MNECDFCCAEKPDAVIRCIYPTPIWPKGQKPSISWMREAMCHRCYLSHIENIHCPDTLRLTLDKNREAAR